MGDQLTFSWLQFSECPAPRSNAYVQSKAQFPFYLFFFFSLNFNTFNTTHLHLMFISSQFHHLRLMSATVRTFRALPRLGLLPNNLLCLPAHLNPSPTVPPRPPPCTDLWSLRYLLRPPSAFMFHQFVIVFPLTVSIIPLLWIYTEHFWTHAAA